MNILTFDYQENGDQLLEKVIELNPYNTVLGPVHNSHDYYVHMGYWIVNLHLIRFQKGNLERMVLDLLSGIRGYEVSGDLKQAQIVMLADDIETGKWMFKHRRINNYLVLDSADQDLNTKLHELVHSG